MRLALAAAILLAVPRTARADEPPRLARVHIAPPEAGQSVVIHDDDRVVRPDHYGDLEIAPGDYRLELVDAQGRSLGITAVHAQGDDTWHVEPPDRTAKWIGLGAGIAGPVLIMAGAAMMIRVIPLDGGACYNDCPTPGDQRLAGLGFVMLLVGAIATPVGWTTFAHNRHPSIETTLPPAPEPEPAPRFSAAIWPHGAALSLGGAF